MMPSERPKAHCEPQRSAPNCIKVTPKHPPRQIRLVFSIGQRSSVSLFEQAPGILRACSPSSIADPEN